jgi:hypothetical protein
MDTPTPSARSRLAALREKRPDTKAAQLRALWPEINLALDRGHSLKVICECLGAGGITVNEKSLAVYIGRIRKQAGQKAVGFTPAALKTPITPTPMPLGAPAVDTGRNQEIPTKHDPLANVHRSEANRPGFHYRAAMPEDEKDLI